MLVLLVSLFALVFCSSSVCFLVPTLILLMSSRSWSYLVIFCSLNKLGYVPSLYKFFYLIFLGLTVFDVMTNTAFISAVFDCV